MAFSIVKDLESYDNRNISFVLLFSLYNAFAAIF